MTSKFKVGDRVRVFAPGKTYEHYTDKFDELQFKDRLINQSFDQHTLAEVFGVTLHDNPNYIETLVAIRDRFSNESLISETGIELLDEIEVVKEKEKVMETQKVSRQGLKEIHGVACGNWKEKLLTYGSRNPFEDYIELSNKEVTEMFKACDTKQRKIVSKYLTEKVPKDLESIIKNIGPVRLHDLTQGLISTRVGGKHEYKAFVLDKQFDWIMDFDDNGFLCLIPTNKE
jgi:uncharacterized membrane protein YheB (UPF0754 family)